MMLPEFVYFVCLYVTTEDRNENLWDARFVVLLKDARSDWHVENFKQNLIKLSVHESV